MPSYATRADLLAALSQDSQAKLTTDVNRRFVCGTGDGVQTTFTTRFVESTALKAYLDGVLQDPAPTLSRGTGTEGRDQVVFAVAPAVGKVVSVSADASAIDADTVDSVLASVSDDIDGYLPTACRPVTDATLLKSLKGKAILWARYRLKGRRNSDVVDPIEREWTAALRWLEAVSKGDIAIPTAAVSTAEPGAYVSGGFAPVFSDPDSGVSL